MSGNLFTPRMSVTSNERYKLQISDEDHAKPMRGQTWEAIVTDIETGVQYQARGAECSAGPRCFCDAIAEPVVEPRTETIYHTMIYLAVDLDNVEGQQIVDALSDLRDDVDRAMKLLKNTDIELVDVFWDKHPYGYGLAFETLDEEVAKAFGFDEMLRPDAEDYELTPWTVGS